METQSHINTLILWLLPAFPPPFQKDPKPYVWKCFLAIRKEREGRKGEGRKGEGRKRRKDNTMKFVVLG